MLRISFSAVAVAAALFALPALADDSELPMDQRVTITHNQGGGDVTRTVTHILDVCIYEGALYSIGGEICIAPDHLQRCMEGDPNHDQPPHWDDYHHQQGVCP